jgi:hypothetical protein
MERARSSREADGALGEVLISFPWEVKVKKPPGVEVQFDHHALRAAHLQPVDEPETDPPSEEAGFHPRDS